jgi:hypothetical protein
VVTHGDPQLFNPSGSHNGCNLFSHLIGLGFIPTLDNALFLAARLRYVSQHLIYHLGSKQLSGYTLASAKAAEFDSLLQKTGTANFNFSDLISTHNQLDRFVQNSNSFTGIDNVGTAFIISIALANIAVSIYSVDITGDTSFSTSSSHTVGYRATNPNQAQRTPIIYSTLFNPNTLKPSPASRAASGGSWQVDTNAARGHFFILTSSGASNAHLSSYIRTRLFCLYFAELGNTDEAKKVSVSYLLSVMRTCQASHATPGNHHQTSNTAPQRNQRPSELEDAMEANRMALLAQYNSLLISTLEAASNLKKGWRRV